LPLVHTPEYFNTFYFKIKYRNRDAQYEDLVIENNFGTGAFFTAVPHCCVSFLLDEIRDGIYGLG